MSSEVIVGGISPLPAINWPYPEIFLRLALALALGLLIGIERERRAKEAGLRTFGFVALLGALGGALGGGYGVAVLILAGVLTVFLNVHALRAGQGLELTTSAAMLVTTFAGILCGQGHTATPAALMVVVAALLAWKQPLAGFSTGLTENELRSALLLAILALVIYPALPHGAVGPWDLIEPRAAWVTVILIAGIGFVNYVLWKMYGTRGIELTGFLGGLVNSSVTVSELASRVRETGDEALGAAYRGIVLATNAMLLRNAVLLGILAPEVLLAAALPYGLMLLAGGVLFAFAERRKVRPSLPTDTPVHLELPFSLWAALKYGLIFLALQVAGVLAERTMGELGFYAVSAIGGLVSSASAVAAAAGVATKGAITPAVAATGDVIASLMSVLVNLPLVARARHPTLMRRLAFAMALVTILGLAGAFVRTEFLGAFLQHNLSSK